MHARTPASPTDRRRRLPRRRPARAAALLASALALALLAGCGGRELRLTDLSKPVQLAAPGQPDKVVGLMLETQLDGPAPITMHIGCKGVVQASVRVPRGRFEQRIDWYSACTELSFPADAARPRSLTIHYRYQTL